MHIQCIDASKLHIISHKYVQILCVNQKEENQRLHPSFSYAGSPSALLALILQQFFLLPEHRGTRPAHSSASAAHFSSPPVLLLSAFPPWCFHSFLTSVGMASSTEFSCLSNTYYLEYQFSDSLVLVSKVLKFSIPLLPYLIFLHLNWAISKNMTCLFKNPKKKAYICRNALWV